MKAIVNVSKKSSHAIYNGMTYEVVEITANSNPRVSLDINGVITDFTANEVMICDIQKEAQKAYDSYNWYSSMYNNKWLAIKAYMLYKYISFTPEYTCPA